MSLTSYRAAPPRGTEWVKIETELPIGKTCCEVNCISLIFFETPCIPSPLSSESAFSIIAE